MPRVLAATASAMLLGGLALVARAHPVLNSAAAAPPSILQPTAKKKGSPLPAPAAPKPRPSATMPAGPGSTPFYSATPIAARHGFVQKKLPVWADDKPIGRVHLAPHQRVIALTFDDGPWPIYTERILATLKREKIHATFFMIGRNVHSYPALARRVAADGNAIGNHTWNHPSRPRGVAAEINRTDAVLKQTLGFTPNLFRPPYGILHNGLADFARHQGKAVLIWSSDSRDWDHGTPGSIYSIIMRQSGPGGIVLMHDGGGNRAATAAALPDVIASLRKRGYRFVTIPELLAMRAPAIPRKKIPWVQAGPKITKKATKKATRKVPTPHTARKPVTTTKERKPRATPVISKTHSVGQKPPATLHAVPTKAGKPHATATALSSRHIVEPHSAPTHKAATKSLSPQ